MRPIIIAIDGPAACGKSTTARMAARRLGYVFIDTGAMYRAFGWYCLQNGLSLAEDNQDQLAIVLSRLDIGFRHNPENQINEVTLNGLGLEPYIRTPEVMKAATLVSSYAGVRRQLVARQQQLGATGGVVMDGRDIGTVVFPGAELKIYLVASEDARVARRVADYADKGIHKSYEDVRLELRERDHNDFTRKESPLRKADDARTLDTTGLSIDQQVEQVCRWAEEVSMAVEPVS